ncbi:sigma-70 family RNA polymerase sigma factor [Acinetobacter sp. VT 511]|uniref:RNA polymerase sigma factor n=1 Tax=Acinetobacter sp. VT 511 TaxID=1675902 RepID=UPI0009D6F392
MKKYQLTESLRLHFYLRKLNRERRFLAHPCSYNTETLSDALTVEREVERTETNEELYRAIDELKLDYQVALLLFYVEGKTYREICQELHLTESVFTQRLARARKKLLHNLQKN